MFNREEEGLVQKLIDHMEIQEFKINKKKRSGGHV